MRKKWKSRIPIIEGNTETTNYIEVKIKFHKKNPHKISKIIYYIYPESFKKEDGYMRVYNYPLDSEIRPPQWEEVLGKLIDENNW